MTGLQRLLFCATAAAFTAGPALAEAPSLPPCKAGGGPVTLVIRTDTTSGWTVNGAPAVAVSNTAWTNVSPATWIGPSGGKGGPSLVYKITFSTPMMHGPMSVQAQWAADNCGASLKAGAGQQSTIPATACAGSSAPNGMDFLSFPHITNANFGAADISGSSSTLTFTVANQNLSATGFAGIFTITAQCVCRDR